MGVQKVGETCCKQVLKGFVGCADWEFISWKLRTQSQYLSRRVKGSDFFFFFPQFGQPPGAVKDYFAFFPHVSFQPSSVGMILSIRKGEHPEG